MNICITPELTQAIINDMIANTAVIIPSGVILAAIFIGITFVALTIRHLFAPDLN